MKYIKDIENLKGVKVLLRLDLNVPLSNDGQKITDDYRIRKSLKTLEYLRSHKAKIIIISHIESQEGSLSPVFKYFKENFSDWNTDFISNYRNAFEKTESMGEGDIIILDNLRKNEGEKKNDREFAKNLASLADIYINEAFSVSHRKHASICAITEFLPSYAGFNFEEEIANLAPALSPDAKRRPFIFILGGAKFETKLPLIQKFMDIAEYVFVGGALAHNFLKEQGKDIKKSVFSPENFGLKIFWENPKYVGKLLLPLDFVEKKEMYLDNGPKTIKMLEEKIKDAKYVLWNGPLGNYELGYKEGTIELARVVAEATSRGVETIIGGGDTLSAISELNIENKFTFISTAGGAMLDFLANGTLPGIEALA